ncbi:hypothetical protein Q8A64_13360 [Oxalobacteraceae bacterium R-40]|uniref:Uncharacterized protein n=1 Tax=Keguizhuia sedimenti TaxID=3064264 RepID=A0ABU1BTV0_9BURK|nr:hypothetical protein [Oxalobacteraceae bacterium R-40]
MPTQDNSIFSIQQHLSVPDSVENNVVHNCLRGNRTVALMPGAGLATKLSLFALRKNVDNERHRNRLAEKPIR